MFKNETFSLVVKVPEEHKERLNDFVKKIQKVAVKLSLPKIEMKRLYNIIEFRAEKTDIWSYEKKRYLQIITQKNFEVIEVSGTPPVLSGWMLLGVLDFERGKPFPMVRSVPGQEVPSNFFTTTSTCDHCSSSRFRKVVYILKHEDGREVQVGSSCLKDFIGHGPIDELVKYYALFDSLSSFGYEEDEVPSGRRNSNSILLDKQDVLGTMIKVIDEMGYVSKKKAQEAALKDEFVETTAEIVSFVEMLRYGFISINPDLFTYNQQKALELSRQELTEEQKERIEKILSTAEHLIPISSFNHNLKNLAISSYWMFKDFPFVAAMFPSCGGFKERVIKEGSENKVSSWVGYQGERKTFSVTIERIISTSSEWGNSYLHSTKDEDGNVITFFNGNKLGEEGEIVTITGTVKKRDDYKGIKQTVLNRVKVAKK
jgi:hypothetical protein